MKLTHTLLAIIAVALVTLAAQPYIHPAPVQAQAAGDEFWFEPGVYMLRQPGGGQVLGKVAVDMKTGNVWGFPTGSNDPYPASLLDAKPLTAHPIPLGKFAMSEAR